MHGDALVQVEQPPAVVLLDHLDVLVVRGLLVQQPVLPLDRARRDRDEHYERRRDDEVARTEEEARRDREERSDDEEGSLRPDRRDEDERRQERPEQRAGGRERVEPAGDRPGSRDARDGETDRERRDHAEQDDRRRAQEQHGEEAADDRARRRLVEALDGQVEERLGHERDRGHEDRGGEHDESEERRLRTAVGDAPAEPVAERQRCEDDADEVRPDDRRGAEVRARAAAMR